MIHELIAEAADLVGVPATAVLITLVLFAGGWLAWKLLKRQRR